MADIFDGGESARAQAFPPEESFSSSNDEQVPEYDVEKILAEQADPDEPSIIRYLVKWVGYPLAEATWEPPENFMNPETFLEWAEEKQRIADGLAPAFNVQEYEKALKLAAEENERDADEAPISEASEASDISDAFDRSYNSIRKKRKKLARKQRHEDELDSLTDDSMAEELVQRQLKKRQNKNKPKGIKSENVENNLQPKNLYPRVITELDESKRRREEEKAQRAFFAERKRAAEECLATTGDVTAEGSTRVPNIPQGTMARRGYPPRGRGRNMGRRSAGARALKDPIKSPANKADSRSSSTGISISLIDRRKAELRGRDRPPPNLDGLTLYKASTGEKVSGPAKDRSIATKATTQTEKPQWGGYDSHASSFEHFGGFDGTSSNSDRVQPEVIDHSVFRDQERSPEEHTAALQSTRTPRTPKQPLNGASSQPKKSLTLAAEVPNPDRPRSLGKLGDQRRPPQQKWEDPHEALNQTDARPRTEIKLLSSEHEMALGRETLQPGGLIQAAFASNKQHLNVRGPPARHMPSTNIILRVATSGLYVGTVKLSSDLTGVTAFMFNDYPTPLVKLEAAVYAEDVKREIRELEPLVTGDVIPYPNTLERVMDICETMRAHQSAFVALSPQYTLMVYPIGISTWSFFDPISPAVEGALMRYRLYAPMQYSLIEYEKEDINMRLTDPSFVDVTEFLDSINNIIVFLNYPMTNDEELNEKKLIGQCLALRGARVIFSGEQQAWIAFIRNPEGGIVLSKPGWTIYCDQPCLRDALLTKIRFHEVGIDNLQNWNCLTDKVEDHIQLVKENLFVGGGTFLMIEDTMKREPKKARDILRWYDKVTAEIPDQWTMFARPDLKNWIWDQINAASGDFGKDTDNHALIELCNMVDSLVPRMDEIYDLYDFIQAHEVPEPSEHAAVYYRGEIKGYDDKDDWGRTEMLFHIWAAWGILQPQQQKRFRRFIAIIPKHLQLKKDEWLARYQNLIILTPDEFLGRCNSFYQPKN